ELIPCLWLPGDDERTFLALLGARDRDWRSGPVKTLGEGLWQVERLDGAAAGGRPFPSRAYCFTNGEDQAIIALMRGGLRESGLFDAAWRGISSNLRFTSRKDIAGLLQHGREQVAKIVEDGAEQYLSKAGGNQYWSLWDQSENADKQFW